MATKMSEGEGRALAARLRRHSWLYGIDGALAGEAADALDALSALLAERVPEELRRLSEACHGIGELSVSRCDDGIYMLHTKGDTVAFGDIMHTDPDDSARFSYLAALHNWFQSLPSPKEES